MHCCACGGGAAVAHSPASVASHANAVRQAKALGDVLVVGIHSDEEIARNKGPPVMKYDERISMLQSMKWVDEIIWCVGARPPHARAGAG